MTIRPGALYLLLTLTAATATAGNGIDPRGSAADYPVHLTTGKLAIGAALVAPAQVRKLFGDDLDKHGYVVFEIGMFPIEATLTDASPDDFKLRQGRDTSILRAATPHDVAADLHPQAPYKAPKLPGNIHTTVDETVVYESGRGGHGVYTATGVGVGLGRDPNAPPPPTATPSTKHDQASLEQLLESLSLPESKTVAPVAGYVIFPKPLLDKRADFELMYFGLEGQVSMKLPATAK